LSDNHIYDDYFENKNKYDELKITTPSAKEAKSRRPTQICCPTCQATNDQGGNK